MPTQGACRLCLRSKQLVESHVFPASAYKRFVSDQRKGGSFLNLRYMNAGPKQFTRNWLCSDCERNLDGKGEKYFFNLIDSGVPIAEYEEPLYHFAVSISWRCALLHFENDQETEHPNAAIEEWRKYLLGELPTAEPYSQYLLSIQSAKWQHWNRAVGGFAMPSIHLVFSTLGPYMVLGITNPHEFTVSDAAILAPARLNATGGKIQFDDSMTDAAYGIRQVKLAIDFWMEVGFNKLTQFAQNADRGRDGSHRR